MRGQGASRRPRREAPRGQRQEVPMALRDAIRSLVINALLVPERCRTGVAYNPLSAEMAQDPYPGYARLRERSPVHRSRLPTGSRTCRTPGAAGRAPAFRGGASSPPHPTRSAGGPARGSAPRSAGPQCRRPATRNAARTARLSGTRGERSSRGPHLARHGRDGPPAPPGMSSAERPRTRARWIRPSARPRPSRRSAPPAIRRDAGSAPPAAASAVREQRTRSPRTAPRGAR